MLTPDDLPRYDISPQLGFLPQQTPLENLEDPYFTPWEQTIGGLQELLTSKRLHSEVEQMPVLCTKRLSSKRDWQRAHSILSFLCHAYMWGDQNSVRERIPLSITIPFMSTCRHLNLPPVANYAALVLWNWKFLTNTTSKAGMEPDNLDTIETFTGSPDEKWFYLISVSIEAQGAPLIPLMLDTMGEAARGNVMEATASLVAFALGIKTLSKSIGRIYEDCDPGVFYNRLRPFLTGSKGAEQAGLPKGIVFDDGGCEKSNHYVQYCGGSNAQSSLFQFFDIVLSVDHQSSQTGFFREMRQYMPPEHARFLEDVADTANIRDFVQRHVHCESLAVAFDSAIAALKAFREKHMEVVTRYVIIPKKQQMEAERLAGTCHNGINRQSPKSHTRGDHERQDRLGLKGTGGTPLIAFLSQARDETSATAVNPKHRQRMLKGRDGHSLAGKKAIA